MFQFDSVMSFVLLLLMLKNVIIMFIVYIWQLLIKVVAVATNQGSCLEQTQYFKDFN